MHDRRIRFELANSRAIGGKRLKLVGNCLQFFMIIPVAILLILSRMPLTKFLIVVPAMELMALGTHWLGVQTIKKMDTVEAQKDER
jgi:hypothetical protein